MSYNLLTPSNSSAYETFFCVLHMLESSSTTVQILFLVVKLHVCHGWVTLKRNLQACVVTQTNF